MTTDDHEHVWYRGKCQHDICRTKRNAQARAYWEMKHQRMLAGLDKPEHGTVGTYSNYRCRCDPCKDANSWYQRSYRSDAKKGTR